MSRRLERSVARFDGTPHGPDHVAPPLGEIAVPQLPEVTRDIPDLLVALPDGGQGRLPGATWPQVAFAAANAGGGSGSPLVAIDAVEKGVVNELYERWEHDLGPCERLYRQEGYVLRVGDRPVAAATSASTVSLQVTGDVNRYNAVDLARIARAEEDPHVLRAMLRLWRMYLAPPWPCWPVHAAVSYALPGKSGDMYRFDGWTRIGRRRASNGGGTYSRPSRVKEIGDGWMTLWVFPYHELELFGPAPRPPRHPRHAARDAQLDEQQRLLHP